MPLCVRCERKIPIIDLRYGYRKMCRECAEELKEIHEACE